MSKSAVEMAHESLSRASDFDDPWLLSYADLVTNLLAMFVLIVSMATISFEMIDGLPGAFDSERASQPNLQTLSADVATLIDKEGLTGRVVAEIDDQGLAIQLQDQIVFPSGVATLTSDGRGLVGRIAKLVGKLPSRYRVLVEGHTDDVPIKTAQFASNWELSAARALEVRAALTTQGVAKDRLAIAAYADNRPLAGQEGLSADQLRKRNRRVVIRVY